MDDLSRFCCLDPDCALYSRRDAGNLTVCGRFGKYKPIRLLSCRACKYRFSERKGTPLFGSHLPEDKARAVLDHLRAGNGTRQTSRLVGVHRDTVTRLARRTGPHAQKVHDELVAFSPLGLGRSSSTRNGPSSPRSRRTATPPMRLRATTGTTSPTTPSTGWSWP